jgi:hypothetical protein
LFAFEPIEIMFTAVLPSILYELFLGVDSVFAGANIEAEARTPTLRRIFMKINKLLLCVILVCFSAPLSLAKDKVDVRDITGCLSKGDDANEFLLTGSDGSTWEVRSSKVALADHVGHTVTATGVVSNATMHNMKEDAKDAAKDSGMTKSDNEHGHLKVTAVKMVSESCK